MSEAESIAAILRLLEIVIGVVQRALSGDSVARLRAHELLVHLSSDAAERAAQESAARRFGAP